MHFSLFDRAEIGARAKETEEGERREKKVSSLSSPLPSSSVSFALVPLSTRSKREKYTIGSDGNGNENVTRKYNFISFVLLRDYFNSLNFYKNGELFRNQIGRSGVQVKKENEKFIVVRLRSPQNLKCGHFTLLFCSGR